MVNWISFKNSPSLFILSKFSTPPHSAYFDPFTYLILPNVPRAPRPSLGPGGGGGGGGPKSNGISLFTSKKQ